MQGQQMLWKGLEGYHRSGGVRSILKFCRRPGRRRNKFLQLGLDGHQGTKGKKFEVCIDVFFVETLVLTVIADMFLSSGSACENKGERGG